MRLNRKEQCLVYETLREIMEATGFSFAFYAEPPTVTGKTNYLGHTFVEGSRLDETAKLLHKMWDEVGPHKLDQIRWLVEDDRAEGKA